MADIFINIITIEQRTLLEIRAISVSTSTTNDCSHSDDFSFGEKKNQIVDSRNTCRHHKRVDYSKKDASNTVDQRTWTADGLSETIHDVDRFGDRYCFMYNLALSL